MIEYLNEEKLFRARDFVKRKPNEEKGRDGLNMKEDDPNYEQAVFDQYIALGGIYKNEKGEKQNIIGGEGHPPIVVK